jgi:hypothetical protein
LVLGVVGVVLVFFVLGGGVFVLGCFWFWRGWFRVWVMACVWVWIWLGLVVFGFVLGYVTLV